MNKNLHTARRNKRDEFYTQLADIEKELIHYRRHFKDKIVLCNCDDPGVSNFYFYFSRNFKILKLKKLVATCYKNNQFDLFSRNDKEQAICHEYIETDKTKEEKEWLLKGDGDFRSDECIELLKQADIVVTNPPFSLFRKYMAQLMEYEKKFLIIGAYYAVTYKEIFPLIRDNKVWIGCSLDGRNIWFGIPDYYEKYHKIENGMKYAFVAGVVWFTNLPHKKQNEELILTKKYKGNEKDYPKYDNYDAIEISKVVDIPKDYNGVMGVPITFLNKYNPEQFEIIGCNSGIDQDPNRIYGRGSFLNGKATFKRLFIKRR